MEITTATVQLDTPDGKMEAYEARPKDGSAHPGIVVLMEAFGVNGHIKDVTERVAREGYMAIAPDVYHREAERVVPYSDMKKAIGLMNQLQDPKVMQDVGAAISRLKAQGAGKIGVMGFCMGGRYTYLSAAHHNKDVAAGVVFYGGGIPMGNPSPLSRTAEIGCPLYLFFGAKDQLIPQEHVAQIKSALADGKKSFALEVYPEPGHGFFCNDRGGYHESSAKDAWEKTKSHFAKHLA
ncbi:MAG: dienelactone hydrolase family protein [Candidatus Binatia bacterium]